MLNSSQLECTAPLSCVSTFVLSARKHLIGRSPRCDVFVNDPSLSRMHAEIEPDKGLLHVRDLTSTNGTFIDAERITEGVLFPHQTLRLGNVSFRFRHRVISPSGPTVSAEGSTLRMISHETASSTLTIQNITAAQKRVLDLLIKGCSEKQAAGVLGISQHTVHHHVQAIYLAFHVHSRSELLALFLDANSVMQSITDIEESG
jgi:DNA-binding CsgD family transcriptional regulator